MKKWIAGIMMGVLFTSTNMLITTANTTNLTAWQSAVYNQLPLVYFDESYEVVADELASFCDGYVRVMQDGKYGYVNEVGVLVIPCVYDSAQSFENGVAYVRKDGRNYYINEKNQEVSYLHEKAYPEGLAIQMLNSSYGFVNENGIRIIPAVYDGAKNFSNGLASMQKNGYWGYIDQSNTTVISFLYEDARGFSEDLAPVKKDGKWGYVDIEGEIVIPFLYDDAFSFTNGKAIVEKEGRYMVIKHPDNISVLITPEATTSPNSSNIQISTPAEEVVVIRETGEATPITTNIYIDEHQVQFAGFLIGDSTYIKLRDLAYMLQGNEKEFEVKWNGTAQELHVYPNQTYTIVGGEMGRIVGLTRMYSENLTDFYIDGRKMDFKKYEIAGDTYFKLRDICSELNMGVIWNQEAQAIMIDTTLTANETSGIPTQHIPFDEAMYQNNHTAETHIAYLEEQFASLNGNIPSKEAEIEIDAYLEYAFAHSDIYDILGEDNHIVVSYDTYKTPMYQQIKFKEDVVELLYQQGLRPRQEYQSTFTINATNISLEEPVTLEFSKDLVKLIEQFQGLKIIVSEEGHAISVKSEDLLKLLYDKDAFTVEVSFEEGYIVINGYYPDGYKREGFYGNVYVEVPVKSSQSTILANQYSDNWGGIYYAETKTLAFATDKAGRYDIFDEIIDIADVMDLPVNLQGKVKFMVSKGYFELNDKNELDTKDLINRYDFISSLVKMFFAQDNEAIPTFTDIPRNSPYYHLIAAAEQEGIVAGYGDHSFKGARLVQYTEIVAFIARTLAEEKGYPYPSDTEATLSIFKDASLIPEWAKPSIAIAVEYDLIPKTEMFEPNRMVTRLEALELLYDFLYKWSI